MDRARALKFSSMDRASKQAVLAICELIVGRTAIINKHAHNYHWNLLLELCNRGK